METILFTLIVLTSLLNAWRDASRIRQGKKENHAEDVFIRGVVGALTTWALYQETGEILHALSFLFLASAVWWIIFDVFMSLALYGDFFQNGSTAWVDRMTGGRHLIWKGVVLLISMMVYAHFGYNVYY